MLVLVFGHVGEYRAQRRAEIVTTGWSNAVTSGQHWEPTAMVSEIWITEPHQTSSL